MRSNAAEGAVARSIMLHFVARCYITLKERLS